MTRRDWVALTIACTFIALAPLIQPRPASKPDGQALLIELEEHCNEGYNHRQRAIFDGLDWGDSSVIRHLSCQAQRRALNALSDVPAERRHEFLAAAMDEVGR
jgi:hypothetical protein